MNFMPELEFTTEDMWWVDSAWNSRMEEVIRLGVSAETSFNGDVDSFISDVFPRARFGRFMSRGCTTNITPSGEFLARLYERHGATDELSDYDETIIPTPSGLSPFETWQWNFVRREGNRHEELRPFPEEPEYAGHIFGSRALLLSQVVEFTTDEAERVAFRLAQEHTGLYSDYSMRRVAIQDALGTQHAYIERDWTSFLSNPVLPTLPAPDDAETNLWDFVTNELIVLAENADDEKDFALVKRLRWIAQNPNSSEALIRRARSILENGRRSQDLYSALAQHPAFPKDGIDLEQLLSTRNSNFEFVYLDDDAFAAKAQEVFQGAEMGPINRIIQELLYDPRREQAAKKIVKDFLREKNWNMLTLALPLLPAVLDEAERDVTGETGKLPLEWLMEVV